MTNKDATTTKLTKLTNQWKNGSLYVLTKAQLISWLIKIYIFSIRPSIILLRKIILYGGITIFSVSVLEKLYMLYIYIKQFPQINTLHISSYWGGCFPKHCNVWTSLTKNQYLKTSGVFGKVTPNRQQFLWL